MSREFPDIRTPEQLRRLMRRVMHQGEMRRIGRDRTAYWLDGTLVLVDPDDPDLGTCFRPVDASPFMATPPDDAPGGALQLSREGLEILHGALRDGWNDLVRAEEDVTARLGAPSPIVLRLILELGAVLSLPYSSAVQEPRDWYWSQLIPVRSPRPDRLEGVRYAVSLSGLEVEVVRRIIPAALDAVAPEFESRVGYSVAAASQLHESLLDSLGR